MPSDSEWNGIALDTISAQVYWLEYTNARTRRYRTDDDDDDRTTPVCADTRAASSSCYSGTHCDDRIMPKRTQPKHEFSFEGKQKHWTHTEHTVNSINVVFFSLLFRAQPYTRIAWAYWTFSVRHVFNCRECSLTVRYTLFRSGLMVLPLALYSRFVFLSFYYSEFSLVAFYSHRLVRMHSRCVADVLSAVAVCVCAVCMGAMCALRCVCLYGFSDQSFCFSLFGRGTLYKFSRFSLLTIIQGLFANESTLWKRFQFLLSHTPETNLFLRFSWRTRKCKTVEYRKRKQKRIYFIFSFVGRLSFCVLLLSPSEIKRSPKRILFPVQK